MPIYGTSHSGVSLTSPAVDGSGKEIYVREFVHLQKVHKKTVDLKCKGDMPLEGT